LPTWGCGTWSSAIRRRGYWDFKAVRSSASWRPTPCAGPAMGTFGSARRWPRMLDTPGSWTPASATSWPVLGLDIGGANIKAATCDGRSVSIPFAMWLRPQDLAQQLVELASGL